MKKITIKHAAFLTLFLLSLTLSACSADAVSIGISPAELYFDNVLKGGYAEGMVAVSTSSETTLNFGIMAEGSIKEWVEFEPSENLTFSKDEMKRIAVIVKPPGNVANGIYKGSIVVSTTASDDGSGGTGVDVTTGTTSDVTIIITGDEIKKARVKSIDVRDTEEGSPLEFLISIFNEGNVIMSPSIEIDIRKSGESDVLKHITHSQTSVMPTKMSIIRVKADTNDLELGDYSAAVEVFLDGEKLSEKTLSFSVLERGTLSKKGVLQKIWNEPWVNAGDVVKIDAYFENTGELLVTGKFKGEIHTGGRLVEIVESEEFEMPTGKTVLMPAYFKPELPGQYVVRGYVVYSGKTTETKESFINVKPLGAATGLAQLDYIVAAVAIIAIFVIIILLKRSFKRGKK